MLLTRITIMHAHLITITCDLFLKSRRVLLHAKPTWKSEQPRLPVRALACRRAAATPSSLMHCESHGETDRAEMAETGSNGDDRLAEMAACHYLLS